jgi:hypothetical protein
MECKVEAVLDELLEAGELPEHDVVKARVQPSPLQSAPTIRVRRPDLAAYDALLDDRGIGS